MVSSFRLFVFAAEQRTTLKVPLFSQLALDGHLGRPQHEAGDRSCCASAFVPMSADACPVFSWVCA